MVLELKVIAVDDERGSLKMVTNAIREADPSADLNSFDSPVAALSFAENNHVDVAFLDIEMPVMTGIELAQKLHDLNNMINIIFVTAYSDYAVDAVDLRVSGYVMKPVMAEDIKKEFDNLRNPVPEGKRIVIRTFGNFDILVDGVALQFARRQAKEILAYLVDKRGLSVPRRELVSNVLSDATYSRQSQTSLSAMMKNLVDTLKAVNADDILIMNPDNYAVDLSKFECDLYDYLDGKSDGMNSYFGQYMENYAWAEVSKEHYFKK